MRVCCFGDAGYKGNRAIFRDDTTRQTVRTHLKKLGLMALAELVWRCSLRPFTDWRWSSLRVNLTELVRFWESLRAVFAVEWFAKMRDKSDLHEVYRSMRDARWLNCFTFVLWYANWLTDMLEWIGGCDCVDCDKAVCWMKGRRIKAAWQFATSVLAEGLATANAWTRHDFGDDFALLSECQGVVRQIHRLGTVKFDYLQHI